MKRVLYAILSLLFIYNIYLFWFEILPMITSEFARGFATLGFIILTPIYIGFAIVAFVVGVLHVGVEHE